MQSQRRSALVLVLVWCVAGSVLGFLVLLARSRGLPLDTFTRDPTAVADLPFYTGALSNLGALLWGGAAAICLFAAALAAPASRRTGAFLLAAGLLSALLGFDDLYQLHEHAAPDMLGLPDDSLMLLYAALMGAFLLAYRADILRGEWILLGAALGLLGVSLAIDLLVDETPVTRFVEDTPKFLGIATWLAYFARTAAAALAPPAPGVAPAAVHAAPARRSTVPP